MIASPVLLLGALPSLDSQVPEKFPDVSKMAKIASKTLLGLPTTCTIPREGLVKSLPNSKSCVGVFFPQCSTAMFPTKAVTMQQKWSGGGSPARTSLLRLPRLATPASYPRGFHSSDYPGQLPGPATREDFTPPATWAGYLVRLPGLVAWADCSEGAPSPVPVIWLLGWSGAGSRLLELVRAIRDTIPHKNLFGPKKQLGVKKCRNPSGTR